MSLPVHPSARRFEQELEIAAPRQIVWEAISTGEGLCRWFAPEATVEPRVGGKVHWKWGGLHSWPQTIEVFEEGTRLLTRYDSPVSDGDGEPQPLFVDFVLSGDGGRTTLRLVHSGFGPEADFDQEYDGISRGWPVELRSLRLYAERHASQDRHVAFSTCTAPDADAAWESLVGPGGLACGAQSAELVEGAAFDFTTADGDHFEGKALQCGPREFTGQVTSHDDGFLRVSIDDCGNGPEVWLWLSTWNGDRGASAAQKQRWDALLARLFAGTHEASVR